MEPKCLRSGSHRLAARRFGQQEPQLHAQLCSVTHAQCGSHIQRVFSHLQKVKGVGADQDRLALRAGLEQVLAAQLDQRPTDEHRIGGGDVRRQFAQRVADPNPRLRVGLGGLAASLVPDARAVEQRRDLRHTVRMPRRPNQERIGGHAGKRIQHGGVLAFAGTGGQPNGSLTAPIAPPISPPGHTALHQFRLRRGVEFEIAGHAHVPRAQATKPLGVGFGLRHHARQ